MKFIISTLIVSIFLFQKVFGQETGKFIDTRDGKEYKTVKIGDQIWMAQNLNFKTNNSWCFKNDLSNCDKYGRLYSYLDAEKACPLGWSLPGEKDWAKLLSHVGPETAALELVEGGQTGFDVKLGGVRYDHGEFNHLGEYAYFWSRISHKDSPAWIYTFARNLPMVHRIQSFPNKGLSVRCFKK